MIGGKELLKFLYVIIATLLHLVLQVRFLALASRPDDL